MRAFASGGGFDVRAIAGSHVVLLAIDANRKPATVCLALHSSARKKPRTDPTG